MVDRVGGNLEGWPSSSGPRSSSTNTSGNGNSSTGGAPSNFNSHRQVYMQQLQHFSHNFAHLTNGYPPHPHHQQQALPSSSNTRGPFAQSYAQGWPQPAHYAAPPASASQHPGAHRPAYPHPSSHLQSTTQTMGHPGAYLSNPAKQLNGTPEDRHYGQKRQDYAHLMHPHYHPPPPPHHPPHHHHHQAVHPHPPHQSHQAAQHFPYPQAHPQAHPQAQPHEAPMNLAPKASPHSQPERTILNTPNYTAIAPGAVTVGAAASTKAETISVPTCIPIQEAFPPPPMITPSVSWKRKISTSNGGSGGEGTEEEPTPLKRLRIEEQQQQHHIQHLPLRRDLKENAKGGGGGGDILHPTPPPSHVFPPGGLAPSMAPYHNAPAPPTTITASHRLPTSTTHPQPPPPPPPTNTTTKGPQPASKKKKEMSSLKQAQQQVLQEQQQFMRMKGTPLSHLPPHHQPHHHPQPPMAHTHEPHKPPPPPTHHPIYQPPPHHQALMMMQQQQQKPPSEPNGRLHHQAVSPPYPPPNSIQQQQTSTYGGHQQTYAPPAMYHQPTTTTCSSSNDTSSTKPTYYTPNSPSYPPPPNPPSAVTQQPPPQISNKTTPPLAVVPPPVSKAPDPTPPPATAIKNNGGGSISSSSSSSSNPPKKGGTLWALPIVPKLPQKPLPKERKPAASKMSKESSSSSSSSSLSSASSGGSASAGNKGTTTGAASFKDVWLSAFGANNNNKSSSNSSSTSSNASMNKTIENGATLMSSASVSGSSSSCSNSSSSSNTNTKNNNNMNDNATGSCSSSVPISSSPPPSASTSSSILESHLSSSSSTVVSAKKAATFKTILDIPPEARRRPRPVYGGILHFPPDWEKAVRFYHEKCRLPTKIVIGMSVSPKILRGSSAKEGDKDQEQGEDQKELPQCVANNQQQMRPSLSVLNSSQSFENSNPEDDLAPSSRTHGSSNSSMTSPFASASTEAPRAVNHVVDSILENRKKLRTTMGRMYKKPSKRRKSNSGCSREDDDADEEEDSEDGPSNCLMPTPGLPLPNSVNPGEILMGSNHGNFRRQTILRYLEMDACSELKAKMLDWKPEVYETKTRRQSNQVRAVTAYREIFGIDLPEKFTNGKSSSPVKKKKRPYVKKALVPAPSLPEEEKGEEQEEKPVPLLLEVKKEEPSEEEQQQPSTSSSSSLSLPVTSRLQPSKPHHLPYLAKAGPSRKIPRKGAPSRHPVDDDDDDEDTRDPTPEEEELQAELQSFALDLLDSNPSWSEKVVIQNLVIWEPIDPVPYVPEKKPKKYYHRKARKRKSGMDFTSASSRNKRQSSSAAAKSREASRVGTPEASEVVDVLYTLDQVIAESKGWVIDKGAGETILHRASKMGYPDVVAYALDMLKIPPSIKDNAGIPPIHKAAFRGHGRIVDTLLRYGVDPNTNVKGTRPLHEALEGGDPMAVYHLLTHGSDPLLYDYSGNMPLDLTEGDEEMRAYLSGILADLHGKTTPRWNISYLKDYITPPQEQEYAEEEAEGDLHAQRDSCLLEFESSSGPLPPYYQFKDHKGHFLRTSDLKDLPESLLKACYLIEMSSDEFIKNSHCCLLGGAALGLVQAEDEGVVQLIRLDDGLRKHLGISRDSLHCSTTSSEEEE